MGWVAVAGIAIFFVGLMLSIGLHEIGHLVPAKLFGVKTTQYMVGFGPTMWSKKKGETEYGIKWIPLGGYVRMIGMLPPGKDGSLRDATTSPIRGMVESAREASFEEIDGEDEKRLFYQKPWYQKLIIMAGGPAMNFLLAAIILSISFMGFGTYVPKPQVDKITDCVIPVSAQRQTCENGDKPTPAAQAGFKSGDKLLSFNGQKVDSWDQLTSLIRGNGGKQVTIGIERDGQPVNLTPSLVTSERYVGKDTSRTEQVGFLGVLPVQVKERQGPALVAETMWDFTANAGNAIINLPNRMVGVWHAAFGDAKRDVNSPVGIIGASRLGGEIAELKVPLADRVQTFLMLLASFNLAIGLFNLLPLLPLDGGHIAGALWEAVKRSFAKLFGRPDPGYVDVAKGLPFAYAIAAVMLVMTVIIMYADVVNPVRLSGN
ncbi:RIP metalloprotease [Pseudonocardiaceae bacterium YIM PH 21723]|nr:RIP metalloprotease [Pseudonocardiaceae bacterium YIM PH 21723]